MRPVATDATWAAAASRNFIVLGSLEGHMAQEPAKRPTMGVAPVQAAVPLWGDGSRHQAGRFRVHLTTLPYDLALNGCPNDQGNRDGQVRVKGNFVLLTGGLRLGRRTRQLQRSKNQVNSRVE